MGVRDASQEAAGTPDPVDKGFATLNTLRYDSFFTRGEAGFLSLLPATFLADFFPQDRNEGVCRESKWVT